MAHGADTWLVVRGYEWSERDELVDLAGRAGLGRAGLGRVEVGARRQFRFPVRFGHVPGHTTPLDGGLVVACGAFGVAIVVRSTHRSRHAAADLEQMARSLEVRDITDPTTGFTAVEAVG
ncbi:hypothetical protein ACQPW3_23610 [Actinosynnema sp. CA-248983]